MLDMFVLSFFVYYTFKIKLMCYYGNPLKNQTSSLYKILL